jgi:hypothetical protein
MTDTHRLTFNKPAVEQLFYAEDGEPADGLRVKLPDNGPVQFLPVHDCDDDDVVELRTRQRGGVEAVIEGELADTLIERLAHDRGPFHVLEPAGGGWLVANPYRKEGHPPKFKPHVRPWAAKKVPTTTRRKTTSDNVEIPSEDGKGAVTVEDMVNTVREAYQTVTEYDAQNIRGRPPKHISEAKVALAEFQKVSLDVFPEIRAAHQMLGRILEKAD